jgi:transcriptional regulator with XRE-family HTH domain
LRRPPRDIQLPADESGTLPAPLHLPASAVLMAGAATRHRSLAELASRLDVSPSHVSRVIKGLVGLSVETCIGLADVLGESRASVLWACGHPHVAVRLFGDSTGTKPRARVRDALDQLTKGDRRLIESLAERLSVLAGLEKAAPSAPTPHSGKKGGAERTRR